jgi:hypothetical protein
MQPLCDVTKRVVGLMLITVFIKKVMDDSNIYKELFVYNSKRQFLKNEKISARG